MRHFFHADDGGQVAGGFGEGIGLAAAFLLVLVQAVEFFGALLGFVEQPLHLALGRLALLNQHGAQERAGEQVAHPGADFPVASFRFNPHEAKAALRQASGMTTAV